MLWNLELEAVELVTCACLPAPIQLMARGLFPCAPQAPTLALDINMLQFASSLFVRSPPNKTAWCDTLEAFLAA